MDTEQQKEYTRELRGTILENSLLNEYMITQSLGDMLDVEIENSYSLSDKSSALSLAAKINLLIDIKGLVKDNKKKLIYYLEIRNQFLHNYHCKTFVDCFTSLKDNYRALHKMYNPANTLSEEEQMTFCYNSLTDDVAKIVVEDVTNAAIKTKALREINKRDLELHKNLRQRVPHLVLEALNSKTLEAYNIELPDKLKVVTEFITKLLERPEVKE